MIKIIKNLIILGLFSLIIMVNSHSSENKILLKINNEIITSIDILNELEYLQIINKEFKNIKKEEAFKISKNSLIKEKIKQIEIKRIIKETKIDKNVLDNLILNYFKDFEILSISDFEKFQEIMEYKRASDLKIFSKLKAIIKPYQKLEFQKISEELEGIDCLYSIQNKKVMNHQMIKSLSQSLKQIEKHCQKIKKEINNSLKKTKVKKEMSPTEIILKDSEGGDITSTSIFEEFSIIAKQCQYLEKANEITDRSSPSLFPDMESPEISLDYFIICLKNLFECVDLSKFKIQDTNAELKTFCWEGILQTSSICYTPYSTFLKSYKRCLKKPPVYFGLSNTIKKEEFFLTRDKIINI